MFFDYCEGRRISKNVLNKNEHHFQYLIGVRKISKSAKFYVDTLTTWNMNHDALLTLSWFSTTQIGVIIMQCFVLEMLTSLTAILKTFNFCNDRCILQTWYSLSKITTN